MHRKAPAAPVPEARNDRMRTTLSPFRRGLAVVAAGAALVTAGPPAAALAAPSADTGSQSHPQLEHLDRGLVAVTTTEGTFLSWRLLGTEVTGASATGMTGADFHVYRDGQRIGTVTDSTNYLDKGAPAGAGYRVAAVVDGQEVDSSDQVTAWAQNSYDLPLQKPAGGVTPAGEAYTYDANDMSVGDVDGDGQYEYVVKWYPSNAKDNSLVGYTGNVYLDTYELDGTLLNRLDLGVNIRAGAHYTQFLVYDFDGDGRSEIMMKTAPGTRTTSYENGRAGKTRYVTMPEADRKAGYANTDDYRMSGGGLLRAPRGDVQGMEHPPRGRRRTLAEDAGGGVRHRADVPVPALGRGRPQARRLLHRRVRAQAQRQQQAAQLRGLRRRRSGVPLGLRRADRP